MSVLAGNFQNVHQRKEKACIMSSVCKNNTAVGSAYLGPLVLIKFKSCWCLCFVDFDPCINVSCNYFAVCKAFGPKDARCICVDNCPSYDEPVCSSNGTTYDNECMFQREMCHLKANFTLYHPGDCTGNSGWSEDKVSIWKQILKRQNWEKHQSAY